MSDRRDAAPTPSTEKELTRAQLVWTGVVLWVAFLVVAGSAALSSFRHIVHVSVLAHQDVWVSYAMPLSIDGSMVISTIAMYRDRVTGRHARPWAKFTLAFGLAVSMYANIASYVADWGWHWGWMFWAGLPPVLLMFSIEVMAKPGRIRQIAHAAVDAVAKARAAVGDLTSTTTTTRPAAAKEADSTDEVALVPAEPAETVPLVASTGHGQAGMPVGPGSGGRRARPEDNEPLPDALIALARQVGGAWRDRTGREITRDGLRAGLRDAGWQRGISNVTAGRLLDLIRNDADGQDDQAQPEVALANRGGM